MRKLIRFANYPKLGWIMTVLNDGQTHVLFGAAPHLLFLPFGVRVWISIWMPPFLVHLAHAFLSEANPVPRSRWFLVGLN